MTHSTPLLSEPKHPPPSRPPASLDDTIERCIGEFGWKQFLQAILVSVAWVFDAQQTFISVFTDSEPGWHCTNSTDSACGAADFCSLPKDAWAWDLPARSSIVSEWGLQCATSFIKGLPSSSFFIGCLVGGLALATLADSSLGRKNMLLLSCLMMSLSSFLTVFSPNVWIYAALRFVNGFGRATIGTCALVLSTELVGKRWRAQVGVIGFFCFTLGFLSLPVMAYVNHGSSWRVLYLWTSIPTIIYCCLVRLLVFESPRWLFVKGRKEEAVSVLRNIASPAESGGLVTMSFSSLSVLEEEEEETNSNVDIYAAIRILIEKRWAVRRLSAVMTVAFGIGMVYYGMPLGLTTLNFNLYLSVVFNALSELPASLIAFFLIGKLNRRGSLVAFTMLSGICSVMVVVLGKLGVSGSLQMVLELVSFFSACSAFNVTLIYTLELFPTCVRNSALSMARQALVLGGAFCPALVAAGRKNQVVSYGLFGVVIAVCGLFVLLLPETKGAVICDTMEEEEHKERAGPADVLA